MNKSDLITIFARKWLEYERAVSDWILAREKFNISYDRNDYSEKTSRRIDKILKKNHITCPNVRKLHDEVTAASHPILDLLFGPNENPIIPEFDIYYSGGYEKWSKEHKEIILNMYYRILGARNKLAFQESRRGDEEHLEIPKIKEKTKEKAMVKSDFRRISWFTRSRPPRSWSFTYRQAIIIKKLCTAHLLGLEDVEKKELADKMGLDDWNFRIQSYIPLKHPAWKGLIEKVPHSKGCYRFNPKFPKNPIKKALERE